MTGEELARFTDLHGELVNGRPPETLSPGDTFRDEEILPGFSLPLCVLFRD